MRIDRIKETLRKILVSLVCIYIPLIYLDNFVTIKSFAIHLAIIISLLLIFLTRIEYFLSRLNISIIFYFFLLLSIIISIILSIDLSHSLNYFNRDFLKAFFLFIIVVFFFTKNDIKLLLLVLLFTSIIYLSLGYYSYIKYDLVFFTSDNKILKCNQNEYATVLAFFFPLLLGFLLYFKNNYLKIFTLILIVLNLNALVLSGTRGAFFSTLISVVLFFTINFSLYKNLCHRYLYLIGGILLTFSIILFYFGFIPPEVKSHLMRTREHLKTFDNRLNFFWIPAVEAIKKRPIFGYGYGNKIHRKEEIFADIEPKPNLSLKGGLHNTFISITFQQGLVGLLIYLSFLLSLIYLLYKESKNTDNELKIFYNSFITMIISSFIINSMVISISYLNSSPFFALATRLVNLSKEENLSDKL